MSEPSPPSWVLQARAVADKEARDAVRDRRSLATALIYPLAMPLLVAVMFSYMTEVASDERELRVPVVGKERAPALMAHLEEAGAILEAFDGDAEQAVRDREIDLALVISEEFAEDLARGKPAQVELIYDGSLNDVTPLVGRTEALLAGWSSRLSLLRVVARGIDPAVLRPMQIERRDVATGAQRSARFFMMLPMFLIMAAFVACLNVAIDATAGERERQSLEPLLTAPVARSALITGKWAVAAAFSLVGVLLTLVTFTLAMRNISFADLGFELHLGPVELGWIVLLLLPMTLLVPALQMLVATFARSYKEAQTYASLLMLVPLAPGMLATFKPIDPEGWMMFVPGLAHQVLLTEVMAGEPLSALGVLGCVAATLAATVALIAVTTKLLGSERIVFGR